MILKALDFFRRRSAGTRTPVKVRRDSNETLAICAVNFWPSFSLAKGFWNFVLTESFGRFWLADEAADADIVLTSVFPHEKAQFPEKTIAVIWENIRPNYEFYRFSISSDFDTYQGRNCRVPNWYEELAWNESFRGPRRLSRERSTDMVTRSGSKSHVSWRRERSSRSSGRNSAAS